MLQQRIERKAKGLHATLNKLDLPPGALIKALNVVIGPDGRIVRRRGLNRHGPQLSEIGKAVFEFLDRIMVLDGTTLKYDPDGTGAAWNSWIGAFNPPDSLTRMRTLEAFKSLFFTTDKGVWKNDSLAGYPYRTGIPVPVFFEPDAPEVIGGTGGGWFLPGNQVGYQIVQGREDANRRVLLSAPSPRHVMVNPIFPGLSWVKQGGGPFFLRVTHTAHGYGAANRLQITDCTFPGGNGEKTISIVDANTYDVPAGAADPGATGTLTAGERAFTELAVIMASDTRPGDFLDTYRTRMSGDSNTDPGFRFFKVRRTAVNFASVTWTFAGGTITVTHTAHAMLTGDPIIIAEASDHRAENGHHRVTRIDANIYTYTVAGAPAASGTAKARWALMGPIEWGPDQLDEAELIGVSGQGEGLYTNDNEEGRDAENWRPPWAKHMAIYKGHVDYGDCRREQFLEVRLLSIDGLTDDIDSITIAGRTYTFSTAEDLVLRKFKRWTTKPTSGQNIEATARSLLAVLNYDGAATVWGEYTTGPSEPRPGKMLFRSKTLGDATFAATVNATTTGDNFEPVLPTSGTTVSSRDDADGSLLFTAKQDQPEAVPKTSFKRVGKPGKKILGIVALTDAELIFKEDGLFVKTGESDGRVGKLFTIEEKDPNLVLRHLWSLVAFENAAHAFTSEGLTRTTRNATFSISRVIQDKILQIANDTIFPESPGKLASGIAYHTDHLYLYLTPQHEGTSGVPAQNRTTISYTIENALLWVWNSESNAWSVWDRRIIAGHVLTVSDRLFLLDAQDPWVLKERKDYTHTDYRDEDISGASVTVNGTKVNAKGQTVSLITITAWPSFQTPPRLPQRGDLLWQSSTVQGKVIAAEDLGGTTWRLELDRLVTFAVAPVKLSLGYVSEVGWIETGGNAAGNKQFSRVQVYLEADEDVHSEIGYLADSQADLEFTFEPDYTSAAMDDALPLFPASALPGPARSTPRGGPVPVDHQRCTALYTYYRNVFCDEPMTILQIAYLFRFFGARTSLVPR